MDKNKFEVLFNAYIVSDNSGWYHGIKDGREVKIMGVTPLPEINTYEYTVMDNNGDFWHIPESDLSNTAKNKEV